MKEQQKKTEVVPLINFLKVLVRIFYKINFM